jgi:hypothetical protein
MICLDLCWVGVQNFLTEEAATAVKELLPAWANGELAETCAWADTQRFRYKWSSPLHFADTPGDCEFSYASTCSLSSPCFKLTRAAMLTVMSTFHACKQVLSLPSTILEFKFEHLKIEGVNAF